MNDLKDEMIKNSQELGLSGLDILVSRADGIPVCNSLDKNLDEISNRSALIVGAWQAAQSVNRDSTSEMRFSFDDSSSGFYVLPLNQNQSHFISAVYDNEVNPGKLKLKLRLLRDSLVGQVTESVTVDSVTEKASFLFDDISDNEIDELFNF